MGYLLLTGCTGLLGRYLMRDLMDAGVELAVLARPSRRKDPWYRVEAALKSWENLLGRRFPRPKVLGGDISSPDFGLSREDYQWALRNCDSILHNAASLSFVTTGRDAEPWRSNVDGTRNVMEFARAASIRKFFHVSTAYISGLRQGRCYEHEVNLGQELGNCYEESKLEAEELVRAADYLDPPTVFRPGIIIGDSQTGLTTTFHNFYAALQLGHTLNAQMGQLDLTGIRSAGMVRFNLDGTERKNLVPVDWVSRMMTHVITEPKFHSETYHLTPRIPTTSRLMRDVIEVSVGAYGIELYGNVPRRTDGSEQEDIFFQHMQVYNSYWRDDPEFDFTNITRVAPHLPCPHVDRQMMLEIARWAIAHRFSWKDPEVVPEAIAS